jgi:thioredoxin reductase (NADPH)
MTQEATQVDRGIAELLDTAPPGETPDLWGAFPRLQEHQIRTVSAYGSRRTTCRGEKLIVAGHQIDTFIVVLAGRVAVVDALGTPEQRIVQLHGRGRFLGELGLLTGQVAFLSSVVVDPGEILELPAQRLVDCATGDPALADVVLRAYLARRHLAIGEGLGFRIIGSRYSPATHRLREFAARNRLPHRFVDLEADDGAESLLRALGVSPAETPVVIWRDKVLRNPDLEELAGLIGQRPQRPPQRLRDLVVVGAGPAGLAAAVYGASEGLDTCVLDAIATGGQAATTSRIENYLGFPAGVSGTELAERAVVQATKFGATTTTPAEAVALEPNGAHHVVRLRDGDTVTARTVIIATGARYRRLPVPRMEEFEQTSVYYAATQIEAQQCVGDPVVVVGGGNSAGQAAIYLADAARDVQLVVREHSLDENMSRYLADRIERDQRIHVHLHAEVRGLLGDDGVLTAVVVEDTVGGTRQTLPARELMVFIGADPCTGWLVGTVALDASGYVRTGGAAVEDGTCDAENLPALLQTSVAGVFAAGDVRSGAVRRVASAVGEGAMAVRMVHEHLARVR